MSIQLNGEHFSAHRRKVIDLLKANKLENTLILMRGGLTKWEAFSDLTLNFYQDHQFYWMTGWNQPDAILLIDVSKNHSILLIPEPDFEETLSVGPAILFEDAITQTGVDEVCYTKDLNTKIQEIYKDSNPIKRLLLAPEPPEEDTDDTTTLLCILAIARKVKFEWEIESLKYATKITCEAIMDVMKNVHPGMSEKFIEADFLYYGLTHEAEGVSFTTMASSGTFNAYAHYHANNRIIEEGSLIVMDCGFFYNHYSGDVTRVFPANGKFSDIQREMYNDMLAIQVQLISEIKPGTTIENLDKSMFQLIFNLLKKYGIYDANLEYNELYSLIFIPHSSSHHIGCCVHDLCSFPVLDNDPILQPNMIISMEPGVYFNPTALDLGKKLNAPINYEKALEYRDSVGGIRIEDDILITNDGCEVLSSMCPKTVEEIEELMTH